jgi:precorrin-3B synthase
MHITTPTPNPSPQGGGEQIRRRGACPGLSAPMATGDGLLVRFSPIGTIPLAAFGAVCDAAKRYGNGIIEITARGNIQVRGLSPASAPEFAEAVAALNIAAEDGIPIFCNPLAGLDPEELIDAGKLAADLRDALARSTLASRLSPKVSIVIDGGGAHRLDGLTADIRARAIQTNDGTSLVIDAAGHDLGSISPSDTVAAVRRLLEVVTRNGREGRARDVISAEGTAAFRAAIADLLNPVGLSRGGNEQTSIGAWRLRDESLACGIALPFGHTDAASLQRLTGAAGIAGAHGFRTAPGRTLLAIGLPEKTAESLVSAAKNLGFIVDAGDPRRHVVACAGAPICGAAHIGARTLGPQIATATAPYLDGTFKIHVSGCAKGCAHPSPAALTIVGTEAGCALVANGSARDTPFMTVAAQELADKAAEIARNIKSGAHHV